MKVDSGRAFDRVDIAEAGPWKRRDKKEDRASERRDDRAENLLSSALPSRRMGLSETEISRCVDASRSVDSS